MNLNDLCHFLASDQYRYSGKNDLADFLRHWRFEPGFRFTVVMRVCAYLRSRWWSRWGLYHFAKLWHRRQQVRYGAYISFETKIGPGLYLGHLCCIIVNTHTVIGKNCTLGHGVTLGQSNTRSRHPGCPVIGDGVYLGCGSVVTGSIQIGDDAVVGPNSVVVKDVPAHSVVSGIPAQIISAKGATGYVAHPFDASHPLH